MSVSRQTGLIEIVALKQLFYKGKEWKEEIKLWVWELVGLNEKQLIKSLCTSRPWSTSFFTLSSTFSEPSCLFCTIKD